MLYRTHNPHGGDIYSHPVTLDFSANTNPLGTPPGVIAAIRDSADSVRSYPDPCCRKLVSAIAEFEDLPREYILCGNGSSELIYSYCRATGADTVLELAPTFSEYSLAARQVSGKVLRYPLRQENAFILDGSFLTYLHRMLPSAVFLCNPNNPTGQTIAPGLLRDIVELCAEKKISLFVDECFQDLTEHPDSLKGLLASHPGLCLLKAFTKSYGMAGMRLGYCLCSDSQLLMRMSVSVPLWNVSTPAQAAGIAALKEQEFLTVARTLITHQRRFLKNALEELGLWVCPSSANYLLFHGPPALHRKLLERGIAIRNCDNYHGLGPGWYRIAVLQQEENEHLILNIRELIREE